MGLHRVLPCERAATPRCLPLETVPPSPDVCAAQGEPALADVPFPSYFSFCSVLLLSLLKFRLKPVLLCCNFYEPLLPS